MPPYEICRLDDGRVDFLVPGKARVIFSPEEWVRVVASVSAHGPVVSLGDLHVIHTGQVLPSASPDQLQVLVIEGRSR